MGGGVICAPRPKHGIIPIVVHKRVKNEGSLIIGVKLVHFKNLISV